MDTPTLDHAVASDAVPLRVLFLSMANAARSQIAEALLVAKGGSRFIVASAGARPAQAVHPAAVRALATLGVDWSGKRPKGFEAVKDLPWDIIISTCDPLNEIAPELPGRLVYAHWGVPDPAACTGDRQDDPFVKTAYLLLWRIGLMLAIRPDVLERTATAQFRASPRAPRYATESNTSFSESVIASL